MRSLLSCFVAVALGCGGATTDIGGSDAATQGDVQQTGPISCNGQTCAADQACVVTTSSGGACLMPDDAGVCPDGTHTTGCCDNVSITYACAKLPDACQGALACPCATSLCECGGCDVADAGVLACECAYP